jgi:hypothetical protein
VDAIEKSAKALGAATSKKSGPENSGPRLKTSQGLVTAATAIPAITTAPVATVSAATTTAAATAIAAATTAATFALLHWARFVDSQGTAVDFLPMELGDGRLGFLSGSHFHEAKAARPSGHAIVDHLHPRDIARLGKKIGQVVFRHAEGQIAHVQFYTHWIL